MTGDISWSARMSAKAKAREDAQREADNRPWAEFVEARGGYWARSAVTSPPT